MICVGVRGRKKERRREGERRKETEGEMDRRQEAKGRQRDGTFQGGFPDPRLCDSILLDETPPHMSDCIASQKLRALTYASLRASSPGLQKNAFSCLHTSIYEHSTCPRAKCVCTRRMYVFSQERSALLRGTFESVDDCTACNCELGLVHHHYLLNHAVRWILLF